MWGMKVELIFDFRGALMVGGVEWHPFTLVGSHLGFLIRWRTIL